MSDNQPIDFSRRFSLARPYNRRSASGQRTAGSDFLLTPERIPELENQLESDRGRIINSAAVRRLQQKTQVFPLERNAAVRSRLTHSLEVQQVGRFIARTIFRKLGRRAGDYRLDGLERASETLVEMACLMHDIGNPPFGHFGEAALSAWFTDHVEELEPFRWIEPGSLTEALVRELTSFEGNAQGIRLISHLQKLNLTWTQAATIVKYTRCATEPKPSGDDPLYKLRKKPGYYFSERDFMADMQQALGMEPGHRHPLTYVMEAADDISYCLADLEDAVDKGLLSYPQLAEELKDTFRSLRPDDHAGAHFGHSGSQRPFDDVIDEALQRAGREPISPEHEFFIWLRVGLIHPLVDHAARSFIDNIEGVFRGCHDKPLLEDSSPCHGVIDTFKDVAFRRVFSVPEVQTLELQGYTIITGLLDHYRPLLALDQNTFGKLHQGRTRGALIESRLYQRLPNKHVRAYLELKQQVPEGISPEVWERYSRCRLVQDMVSGMTDQFALDEFRTLSVIDC